MFNVLLDDAEWCATTGCCEIGRGPEHVLPVAGFDFRHAFAQHVTGNTFERIYERGDCNFRRVVHEQVNVVFLAVHLYQLSVKVSADLGEDMLQLLNSFAIKDATPVFGHEDQMDVHCENTVSTVR